MKDNEFTWIPGSKCAQELPTEQLPGSVKITYILSILMPTHLKLCWDAMIMTREQRTLSEW